MRVTIIGSGNVATLFGRKILAAGHIIVQVYGRNADHAAQLANELQAEPVDDIKAISDMADLYILCIADKAVETVTKQLFLPGKLIAHTAGSISLQVLKKVSDNYGILYPLQSIRKEITPAPFLPILVDGNNDVTKQQLFSFAESFANLVAFADDEQRSKLHLAAVVSNNFSNYLFHLAEEYCTKEKVDFKMIVPLLEETARRLHFTSPAAVQTGPAIRNDVTTIQRHLEMLQPYPELRQLYADFSSRIVSCFNEKTAKAGE